MGIFLSPNVIYPVAATGAVAAALLATAATLKKRTHTSAAPSYFIWTVALVYGGVFSAITLIRHAAFATYGLDLGYYGNVIYHFGHGRPFAQTLLPADGYLNHCAPLLLVLAPFTYVFSDPGYLLPLQSLTLAAGVPLIYYLARPSRNGSWAAACLALGYALTPALHAANLYDFHPRALGVPLALGALLLFRKGKFNAGLALTALFALAEDELALHAVGLAFCGGILAGRRRAGAVATFAFAVYFVVVALWLYPRLTYAGGGSDPHYTHYFAYHEILNDPAAWGRAAGPYKLGYLGLILLPALAFIPTAGWAALTLVTPLAVVVPSTVETTYQLGWQYPLSLLPFIYGAAALGLRRLGTNAPGARRRWFVAFGAGAAIILPVAFVPTAALPYYREVAGHLLPGPYERALGEAVRRVPRDAVVAADDRLCAHLAHRPFIYSYYPAITAAVPRPREAVLLERRAHNLLEVVALRKRMEQWGLCLKSYDGDYAYYATGEKSGDAEGLFRAWFGSVEEWQCLAGAGKRVVADPWARDGRAMFSPGVVSCPSSPSYVYPPGDYHLTFFIRPASAEPCGSNVLVKLTDPNTGNDLNAPHVDVSDVTPESYTGIEVPFTAPRPFLLSFVLTSDAPFFFDGCVVEGTHYNVEGITKVMEWGYSPRALRTKKENRLQRP